MGYTTEFSGKIKVSPPLNAEEIAYLKKFNEARHVTREQGPYFVDGNGIFIVDDPGGVIADRPQDPQPGYWCQWIPTDDGTAIEWDQGEKFYDSAEWMAYIIQHFLMPGALAPLPFLQKNHILDGAIEAHGEERGDDWELVVENNLVSVQALESVPTRGTKRRIG